MLKFLALDNGQPAASWALRNAHMIGADGNAVRAEITFGDGVVRCDKRESGSAALALQMPVGDCGELTARTCLLPARDEPYLLNLELARHHLMVLFNKLEDWGMFDLDPDHPVRRRSALAQRLFIGALCRQQDDPAGAEKMARDCLVASIDGGEELALAHAQLLLDRRKSSGGLPRLPIGCGICAQQNGERLRAGLAANFDFIYLPVSWRALAPEETDYRWSMMDSWIDWATRTRIPVYAGPLVSFEPHMLPDWLYIWEHDFDTVRDLIYEHVERIVDRYAGSVNIWNVISGLHVNSHFSFTFDQIMDLTRMTTMLVKRMQPTAKVLIEIREPFGEYYGANPRSIPPLMYADLLIQSAVNFDGFSVKLLMGQARPGQYTRDLMQISGLLDQFASLGKPLTLVAAVPSDPVTQIMITPGENGEMVDDNCGHWRRPWSPQVQSHWLEALFQIALSKPFVESVAWHDLVDHPAIELPLGGLVNEDQQPKGAFRRLVTFRRALTEGHSAAETM